MSYLVTVTFDLKNGTAAQYTSAGDALTALGFRKKVTGSTGKSHDLPTTTYVGEFNGENAEKVRSDLAQQVNDSFTRKGLKASIFLAVGGDWAWAIRYT